MSLALLGAACAPDEPEPPTTHETSDAGGASAEPVDVDATLDGEPDVELPEAELSIAPAPENTLLEVSAEAYELLSALPYGTSVHAYDREPGVAAFQQEFFSTFPGAGAATAVCDDVVVPATSEGCAELWPDLVASKSYDPDAAELGLGALEASLDHPYVCGLGHHEVRATVYDADGTSGTCSSDVYLCDPTSDPDCPDAPVIQNGPIAVADTCAGAVRCAWITPAWRLLPPSVTKQTTASDERTYVGLGPFHAHVDQSSGGRNCHADDVDQAEAPSGEVRLDVSLVCFDAQGARCDVDCTRKVEVQAYYRSTVEARTKLGMTCEPFWDNETEAFAQDEALLTVNGAVAFSKGVLAQNGSHVTTEASFEIGAEGGGSEKEGAAGSVSTTLGRTVSRTDETGNSGVLPLNAFAQSSVDAPMTAILSSQGRTSARVRSRAHAMAAVTGDDWVVFYVAKSSCPAAGWTGFGESFGPKSKSVEGDEQAANEFFASRGVTTYFPK